MDQSLRLLPPSVDELPLTIRGPFEKNPGMFANPLTAAVCEQLEAELRERSAGGFQNPTEGQIAGLMLWLAKEPEKLLAARKVQGLLEDFLVQQLEALPMAERAPAVALLSCLVTDAGTRNIVSRSDLVDRVTESESVTEEAVSATLDALVQNTGLVRQEFRDRTAFYQIISEFLVPWIRDQKADRARIEAERTLAHERQAAAERLAQEREAAEQKLALQSAEADRLRAKDLAETLRKVRRSRAVLAVLLVLLLGGWSLAAWQTGQARREKAIAVQEKIQADSARETSAHDRDAAKAAEDSARTALDQTSLLVKATQERLDSANRALIQSHDAAQSLIQSLKAGAAGAAVSDELLQKLTALAQTSEDAARQVSESIDSTKRDVASVKSPPGWSLYGRLEGETWLERYFHGETSQLALPKAGDTVMADTFVNVREHPNKYDSNAKAWDSAKIVGMIIPGQRLKVTEARAVNGPAGDTITRVWIHTEAPPPL